MPSADTDDSCARTLTRRQALSTALIATPALVLAACGQVEQEAPPASPSAATAEVGLAERVAGAETALIVMYDSAIAALDAADADLRSLLVDLRDQHVAHRSALGASGALPPSGAVDPLAPVTVAALVAAERQAARDRLRDCEEAPDSDLARTLAFIAASEASHVPVLKDAT